MEEFKFRGDWETQISLEIFDKELDDNRFAFRRKNLAPTEYLMLIDDVFDVNPDPSQEQLNTLDFIQSKSNQKSTLANLFDYIKNIIYPEYQEYISEDEYPGTFPKLEKLQDLKNVIGLDHVTILRFGKDNFVYYNLMFETTLDEEHGLGFVMHKNEIIEHGEIGGLMYGKVANHMGKSNEEYSDFQSKIQTASASNYQVASKKYGKLKPWQVDFNRNYLYLLYSNGDDKELINFIESENITINEAFEKIKPHMTRDNRTLLIEYFKSNGKK